MTNKFGGSFTIEVSTIFPHCKNEESNYNTQEFESVDDVTVYSTSNRYRLEGMFDGWFYYTDVYKYKVRVSLFRWFDCYESVGEQRIKNFKPNEKMIQVQKYDDLLCSKISNEVNCQMEKAYKWWSKNNAPQKVMGLKWYNW